MVVQLILSYQVDWQHYKNCILLTQHNELNQLNTKIHKIIELQFGPPNFSSYIVVTLKKVIKLWIYQCLNRSWTPSNKNNPGWRSKKRLQFDIFWRPTVGKQQIRIVPSAFNPKEPIYRT